MIIINAIKIKNNREYNRNIMIINFIITRYANREKGKERRWIIKINIITCKVVRHEKFSLRIVSLSFGISLGDVS